MTKIYMSKIVEAVVKAKRKKIFQYRVFRRIKYPHLKTLSPKISKIKSDTIFISNKETFL